MKLFNGILGVLSIFGALFCIFWPEASFLNAGWIIALVLGLWGICSIVTFFIDKSYGDVDKENAGKGLLGLVIGITALVVSILSMFMPVVEGVFMLILLVLFVVFLFVYGISSIVKAIKTKKKSKKSKKWIGSLILGIISILVGMVAVGDWFIAADLVSIFIGIMLGVFGCILIASIFQPDDVDRLDRMAGGDK